MGLSIHYSLRSDVESSHEVQSLIERLHQAARDLPFTEVGDIVEIAGRDAADREGIDDEQRWLFAQAHRWLIRDIGVARVAPLHVIAFPTIPGPGSEPANFGLCRYPATVEIESESVSTEFVGWSWQSSCKTQYASNPNDGGVENFIRCHVTIVRLLDSAARLNLLGEVNDESEFWNNRDVRALAETVGKWNRTMAAVVGQIIDELGDQYVAPITDFPNFEHLEADGRSGGAEPR